MADPEADHGFFSIGDGHTSINLYLFFDVGFGHDITVDDYINRVSFTLAEAIESRLGVHHRQQTYFPDTPLHPSYVALQSLHHADPVPDMSATVITENCSVPPSEYKLLALVSHIGTSTQCGHYVAHVRKEGRWVIFNDSKVGVSADPPLDMGYLYFFERIDG